MKKAKYVVEVDEWTRKNLKVLAALYGTTMKQLIRDLVWKEKKAANLVNLDEEDK